VGGDCEESGVSEVWAECEFKHAAFIIELTRLFFYSVRARSEFFLFA